MPGKTCSWVGGTLVGMSKELVSDEVWEIVEPLLPEEPPEPGGSRPRVPDRAALAGIVFVLKSGIRWEMPSSPRGEGPRVRELLEPLRDVHGIYDTKYHTV